jgi:hypothetical protein
VAHCLALQNLYRKFVKDEEPPKAFFDLLGANRVSESVSPLSTAIYLSLV